MRKILLASLFLIIAILSISIASASVSVANTFSSSNPTFGSSSQQASNPNADSSSDKNIYINSTNIILTNDNSTPVNVTAVSFTNYKTGFSSSDFSLSYVGSLPTNITNTSNGTLVLNARIPEELDAVDSDGDPVAIKIADAVLTLSDNSSLTVPLYMQRENKLEIDKIYAEINGNSDSDSSNPANFDVERTDSVIIKVKIKNDYDENDDDVDIEDITIYGDLDGDLAEDEDDVEDIDEDASDLDSEDYDTVELMTFKVNEEADGDYTGTIYVIGEDEHGAKHGEKWNITFDVDVETHDLRITEATLSPAQISCDRTVRLYVDGINLGKRDEDDVRITVTNSDLNIEDQELIGDVENDADDNDFSATFNFDINDSIESGTYPIYIKLYRDFDELEYSISTNLEITECNAVTTQETEESSTTVVSTSTTIAEETETESGEEAVTSTETSFFESSTYTNILIGVNIIAILAVIALIITVLKPKV